MVDHWVMHYTWESTHFCNYCSMDLGLLTSESCALFSITPLSHATPQGIELGTKDKMRGKFRWSLPLEEYSVVGERDMNKIIITFMQ